MVLMLTRPEIVLLRDLRFDYIFELQSILWPPLRKLLLLQQIVIERVYFDLHDLPADIPAVWRDSTALREQHFELIKAAIWNKLWLPFRSAVWNRFEGGGKRTIGTTHPSANRLRFETFSQLKAQLSLSLSSLNSRVMQSPALPTTVDEIFDAGIENYINMKLPLEY